MIGMIADAEGALNHLRHPFGGPDIAREAVRWRSAGQQRGKLCPLLNREAWRYSRRWPVCQRLDPLLARARTPVADRTLTSPQRHGDVLLVLLLPPRLFQGPGALAPLFAPISPLGGSSCSHASERPPTSLLCTGISRVVEEWASNPPSSR